MSTVFQSYFLHLVSKSLVRLQIKPIKKERKKERKKEENKEKYSDILDIKTKITQLASGGGEV